MAARRSRVLGFMVCLVALVAAGAAFYVGRAAYLGARTVRELLTENRRLKESIANLTQESQIGYAKVTAQETREGRLYTTLVFVETARDDPARRILEKHFTIEGDVVHFDALIVKFGDQLVMDGRERALYLWRRVYGEHTAPADGFPIEQAGAEPERYRDLLARLHVSERAMFWTALWDLAANPERLRQYGIQAAYGNAVYTQLRPNVVYAFKINAQGQVYPEVMPDL